MVTEPGDKISKISGSFTELINCRNKKQQFRIIWFSHCIIFYFSDPRSRAVKELGNDRRITELMHSKY